MKFCADIMSTFEIAHVRDTVLFTAAKAKHGIPCWGARDYIYVFAFGRINAYLMEKGFEESTWTVGKGAACLGVSGGKKFPYD